MLFAAARADKAGYCVTHPQRGTRRDGYCAMRREGNGRPLLSWSSKRPEHSARRMRKNTSGLPGRSSAETSVGARGGETDVSLACWGSIQSRSSCMRHLVECAPDNHADPARQILDVLYLEAGDWVRARYAQSQPLDSIAIYVLPIMDIAHRRHIDFAISGAAEMARNRAS